jgi:hypothetical protein
MNCLSTGAALQSIVKEKVFFIISLPALIVEKKTHTGPATALGTNIA